MPRFGRFAPIIGIGSLLLSGAAYAATVVQYNFNSNPPDASLTTGTTSPSTNNATSAPTLTLIGGTTATFASGSTRDPAPSADNTGWNTSGYPAQGTATDTAGIELDVNTTGFTQPLRFNFDQRTSNTASKYYDLFVSTDGTNFTKLDTLIVPTGGNVFTTYDEALPAAASNNPNLKLRIVSAFDPANNTSYSTATASSYSSAGTVRYDMVTITDLLVPEPTSLGLLAAGVPVLALRRRRAR